MADPHKDWRATAWRQLVNPRRGTRTRHRPAPTRLPNHLVSYNPGTDLDYRQLNSQSKWGGTRGVNYNQYFEGPKASAADEDMWAIARAGDYRLGVVINHNRPPVLRRSSKAWGMRSSSTPQQGRNRRLCGADRERGCQVHEDRPEGRPDHHGSPQPHLLLTTCLKCRPA